MAIQFRPSLDDDDVFVLHVEIALGLRTAQNIPVPKTNARSVAQQVDATTIGKLGQRPRLGEHFDQAYRLPILLASSRSDLTHDVHNKRRGLQEDGHVGIFQVALKCFFEVLSQSLSRETHDGLIAQQRHRHLP